METLTTNYQQQPLALTPRTLQATFSTTLHPCIKNIQMNVANPIVACASPILALFIQLRRTIVGGEIQLLHQNLVAAITNFGLKAAEKQIAPSDIDMARYVLCALLDEAVLNQQMHEKSDWDGKTDWSKKSLISTFYQDIWGGEVFFAIADHLLEKPAKHIEILELVYFCLQLGFEGKYRIIENGQEQLNLLREKVYFALHIDRESLNQNFDTLATKNPAQKSKMPFLKLIVALVISVMGLTSFYLFLNQQLHSNAEILAKNLQSLL